MNVTAAAEPCMDWNPGGLKLEMCHFIAVLINAQGSMDQKHDTH